MSKINQNALPQNLQRRQFLTGLSIALAATSVSTCINATEMSSPEHIKNEKKSSSYRETQHIRDYYNSL